MIKTIVGGGRPTFTSGSNALESILEGASGVTADAFGNRYVAGFLANRVFKINPAGRVTVVAGTGAASTSGDGGAATDAAVYGPSSVAVDGNSLYIVEQLGNRIRRVDEAGKITTVAGGGAKETAGKEDLPATAAYLEVPNGIALKDGEIFFTEFGGNRVRKIDREGTLTTVAGTGDAATGGDGGRAKAASLHGPTGIVVDGRGHVYVAEMFGGRVRRVDPGGSIATFVGSGPRGESFEGRQATAASLRAPNGLALDAAGQLYVSDFADNRIYIVNPDSGIIKTLAGTRSAPSVGNIGVARSGPARQVPVESPLGLALDPAGRLLVALYNQGAVLSVEPQDSTLASDPSPVIRHVAGEFAPPLTSGIKPTELYLKNAASVATDSQGNVFVSDVFANRVIKVSADDTRASTLVGATSSGDGAAGDILHVHHPVGVVPIANGIVVLEADSHHVRFISNHTLALRHKEYGSGAAQGIRPVSGARKSFLDHYGGEYYMDESTDHPHYGETYSATATSYTYSPGGDSLAGGEAKPDLVKVAGKRTPAKSSARASRGGKRTVEPFFVYADTGNNRVRIINERGVASTLAGNGKPVSSGDGKQAIHAGLAHPQAVAVDADGNVYISEAHRVRRVDIQTGIITTVVGTGKRGFSGFGGPATQASITSAYGMEVDGKDLYIADPWAGVVYKVDGNGIITVVAGTGERNSSGDGGPPAKAGLNVPVDVAIRRMSDGVHLLIAELEGGRVRSFQLR